MRWDLGVRPLNERCQAAVPAAGAAAALAPLCRLPPAPAGVACCRFAPDGRSLAVGCAFGKVAVYDLATQSLRGVYDSPAAAAAAGGGFAAGGGGTPHFAAAGGAAFTAAAGAGAGVGGSRPQLTVADVAWTADSRCLVVAGAGGGSLVDVVSVAHLPARAPAGAAGGAGAAAGPGAAGAVCGRVIHASAAGGGGSEAVPAAATAAAAAARSGDVFFTAGTDEMIRSWDLRNFHLVAEVRAHEGPVTSLALDGGGAGGAGAAGGGVGAAGAAGGGVGIAGGVGVAGGAGAASGKDDSEGDGFGGAAAGSAAGSAAAADGGVAALISAGMDGVVRLWDPRFLEPQKSLSGRDRAPLVHAVPLPLSHEVLALDVHGCARAHPLGGRRRPWNLVAVERGERTWSAALEAAPDVFRPQTASAFGGVSRVELAHSPGPFVRACTVGPLVFVPRTAESEGNGAGTGIAARDTFVDAWDCERRCYVGRVRLYDGHPGVSAVTAVDGFAWGGVGLLAAGSWYPDAAVTLVAVDLAAAREAQVPEAEPPQAGRSPSGAAEPASPAAAASRLSRNPER